MTSMVMFQTTQGFNVAIQPEHVMTADDEGNDIAIRLVGNVIYHVSKVYYDVSSTIEKLGLKYKYPANTGPR